MKKEVAKLWLDALRSKKYKKTTGALCHEINGQEQNFCALGVLVDLYQQTHKRKLKVDKSEPLEFEEEVAGSKRKRKVKKAEVYFEDADGLLPEKVQKWAGMKTNDGQLNPAELDDDDPYCFMSIPDLNDEEELSLEEIADVIEPRVAKL